MITKDKVENSDSYLAQGGICTLKSADDFDAFYQDTLKAGRNENNPESVKIMIQQAPQIMKDLMDYGVEFDRDTEGNFQLIHVKVLTRNIGFYIIRMLLVKKSLLN